MAVQPNAAAHAQPVQPRRALMLAWRLEARAQAQRGFAKPIRTIATIVALTLLALLAIGAAWSTSCEPIGALLVLANAHPFALGLSGALAAFVGLQTHRRRAERNHAASWLASAPIERRDVVAFLRWRAGAFAIPLGAIPIALIAALGSAADRNVRLPCLLLGPGLVAGAIAGWRSGARAPADAAAALPRLRARVSTTTSSAGFDALRRWPFAQLLAAISPRQHARIVAAVLLTMPMGIPLSVVVTMLLLLLTCVGAVALLQALLATIPRAADVLRSTPLTLPHWAARLSGRVFVSQLAAAALAAVLGHVLGASAVAALTGAVAWLLWVMLAALCAFAARYRPAQLRCELMAMAIVLSALTALAPLLLLLALPALAGWLAWRAWRA